MQAAIFDFETDGLEAEYALQPWRSPKEAWPTVFVGCTINLDGDESIGDKICLTYPTPGAVNEWFEQVSDSVDVFVAYNAVFDAAWLCQLGLRSTAMELRWIDALVLAKMADGLERQWRRDQNRWDDVSYSLKAEVKRRLPDLAGYEQDVQYHYGKRGVVDDNYWKLVEYAKIDAVATALLTRQYWQELGPKQRQRAFDISQSVPLLADAWFRGITIDEPLVRELQKEAVDAKASIREKLGLDEATLASPELLSKQLFETWGLTPTIITKTGQPSTSQDALAAIDDPRVRLVSAYSKCSSIVSKFCVPTLNSAHYCGGKTHPSPHLYSTYTGRITYSSKQGKGVRAKQTGIAIHQWAKFPQVRNIFLPPEGCWIVELDFAGQEMRLMADLSRDETMRSIFEEGLDGHSLMGANIAGIPYDEFVERYKAGELKRERQLGKLANLSLQYRTSVKTLKMRAASQFGIRLSEYEAKHIKDTYQRTYPKVREYHRSAVYLAQQNGYAETAGGCRVIISDWSNSWRAEQTAINYPIQGTGADQKYLALRLLKPLVKQYSAYFAWDLHDGMFFFVPKRSAKEFARNAKTIIDGIDYRHEGFNLDLTYPVDIAAGPRWGEMEEVR